jgi:hypothetical protein
LETEQHRLIQSTQHIEEEISTFTFESIYQSINFYLKMYDNDIKIIVTKSKTRKTKMNRLRHTIAQIICKILQ